MGVGGHKQGNDNRSGDVRHDNVRRDPSGGAPGRDIVGRPRLNRVTCRGGPATPSVFVVKIEKPPKLALLELQEGRVLEPVHVRYHDNTGESGRPGGK